MAVSLEESVLLIEAREGESAGGISITAPIFDCDPGSGLDWGLKRASLGLANEIHDSLHMLSHIGLSGRNEFPIKSKPCFLAPCSA